MAFEVRVSSSTPFPIVILKDLATGTFAEIYCFGALLNNFTSSHHQLHHNFIDGFASVSEAVDTITPFFKSAKLSPFVCRLKDAKYHFGEKSYLITKYLSHGNALHGLLFNQVFKIAAQHHSETEASVSLQYDYNNPDEGFPFVYTCTVEYKLSSGNTLAVKTTIKNQDEKLMPVADGWHPYFTLGDRIDDYQVEFQSLQMLVFDEGLIPTGSYIPYDTFSSLRNFGTTFFDNCFTLDMQECQPSCVIRNPGKKIQLEIHPSNSYPFLQIYTPDHRKSIAIENLSAAPDAFNNAIGLKILSPHEEVTFATKFITKSI